VRGHVDAAKHPIRIGDLPVTSDARTVETMSSHSEGSSMARRR
jgi:hypothetical protein